MTNVANEEQVGRFRNREKTRAVQEDADLRSVLKTPAGRRLAARVFERCHWRQTSWRDNPQVAAFVEGERNVGLWLMAESERVAPDDLVAALTSEIRDRDRDRKETKDE